ncbi:MAG: hypothetical protein WC821_00725 [archaeon]|jgi:hypothetical protein
MLPYKVYKLSVKNPHKRFGVLPKSPVARAELSRKIEIRLTKLKYHRHVATLAFIDKQKLDATIRHLQRVQKRLNERK